MSENKFDVDAGWDGPDWRSGFYGIVFDSRGDGDEFISFVARKLIDLQSIE